MTFDMARYLAGKEVKRSMQMVGCRIDPEIGKVGDLDTVLIMLKFDDGTFGTIDNSEKATYGYDQRVEVFGSKGAVHINNNYPNAAIISAGDSIHSMTFRYISLWKDILKATWQKSRLLPKLYYMIHQHKLPDWMDVLRLLWGWLRSYPSMKNDRSNCLK